MPDAPRRHRDGLGRRYGQANFAAYSYLSGYPQRNGESDISSTCAAGCVP